MNELESVRALIDLENEAPEPLFDSVNGIHIWPLIRVGLGLRSAGKELASGSTRGPWRRSNPVKQVAALAVPNSANSYRVRRDADALFLTVGATTQPTPVGSENWLVDYFASSLGDQAVALQDRRISARSAPEEKPAFGNTYSLHDANLRVLVKSRLRRLPQDVEDRVRRTVREIISRYQFDVDASLVHTLEGKAVQHVQRAPHWRSEFDRILNRTKPGLVVMDLSSYMTRVAITQTIRRHGIPIAELQHGWIGRSHAAYNFGGAFFGSELEQYLPDYLLTFGDFWSEGLRTPSRQVAIGKPYLEKMAKGHPGTTRNQVLITSSIYQTEDLVRLALTIRDESPRHINVAVRPHPRERARAETLFAELANQERISIDLDPDVYSSFSKSKAVVGYASTVLFEALAFNVPVVVIDSPLADMYAPTSVFGEHISADGPVQAVVDRIMGRHDGARANDLNTVDRIWKPNAVENFAEFLASINTVDVPTQP